MKEFTITVQVYYPEDISEEDIASEIDCAIGVAQNEGLWPYKYHFEIVR
jgi:hypothetical protein